MVTEKERPFRGLAKLVSNLQSKHNISVSDPESAQKILLEHSYYTLVNGYQRALEKEPNSEKFQDGISIEMLHRMHLTETDLAATLLQAILDIEKKLRTAIQYSVSRNFGISVEEYLNKKNYITVRTYTDGSEKKMDRSKITGKLRTIATGYKNGNSSDLKNKIRSEHPSQSLLEHRLAGDVPPWILVNDLTFGELLKWFKILAPKNKEEVIRLAFPNVDIRKEKDDKSFFDANIQFISLALELLREYRNGFAHGDVLNKISIVASLDSYDIRLITNGDDRIVSNAELSRGIGTKDLLALILILLTLSSESRATASYSRLKNTFLEVNRFVGSINSAPIRKVYLIPDNMIHRIDAIRTLTK